MIRKIIAAGVVLVCIVSVVLLLTYTPAQPPQGGPALEVTTTASYTASFAGPESTGTVSTAPVEKPTASASQTVAPTTQPVTTVPQTTAPVTQPTATTTPTAAPTMPTAAPDTKPAVPTTQSTASTTRPTISATQSTAPTTQPTIPATQPSAPTTQPAGTLPVWQEPDYQLQSQYCFVYDAGADEMLFAKGDPGSQVYPASLTKLFSVYVALQYLQPDQVITVGTEVELIDKCSSRAGIGVGYRLTVEMLAQGMIMCSGNDAAYALAAAAGYAIAGEEGLTPEQAVAQFVDEMNRQAEELGLTGTHFTCPDGIHNKKHYTTAADLLVISRLSMENELVRRYAAMQEAIVTFASGQRVQWQNTNALLYPDSPYYIPDTLGLKTGTEGPAGHCLVSVFPKGENYVYILVLKGPTSGKRSQDTMYLYETFVQG